jgi:hypothetical protein
MTEGKQHGEAKATEARGESGDMRAEAEASDPD